MEQADFDSWRFQFQNMAKTNVETAHALSLPLLNIFKSAHLLNLQIRFTLSHLQNPANTYISPSVFLFW